MSTRRKKYGPPELAEQVLARYRRAADEFLAARDFDRMVSQSDELVEQVRTATTVDDLEGGAR